MALAGAMKVRVDTKTSSSGRIPETRSAIWSAVVPWSVATPYFAPTYLTTAVSKRSTAGPADETHFVSRHSLMYFHSLPRISGSQSGIISSGRAASGSDRRVIGAISFKAFSLLAKAFCSQNRAGPFGSLPPGQYLTNTHGWENPRLDNLRQSTD